MPLFSMGSKDFPSKKSPPLWTANRTRCGLPLPPPGSTCESRPPWPTNSATNSCKIPAPLKPNQHSGEIVMITREDIRELAQFQPNEEEVCALSFYFQPHTPSNKSHKEDAILAKDLVKQALREAEKNGKRGCARKDLERILDIAGSLHGNQARAKAIFACSAKNFWRE